MTRKSISTKVVHAGERLDPQTKSLTTPIYQSSVFGFETADDMIAAFEGKPDAYIYSRIANPTIAAVEKKLAEIENGEDAILFASGLAASYAIFASLIKSGDHIISAGDIYGGTATQLKEFIPNLGVEVSFVDLINDPEVNIQKNIRPNTKFVFFETPTNPTIKIVDIEAVVRAVKKRQLLTVMDNTFASPVNQQPLSMGIDISYHSATKYLGGHDDLTAGVVIGRAEMLKQIRRYRTYVGASIDPQTAWLLGRGIKTLDVRMERQNKNALVLAKHLSTNPKVKRVFYPGLESSPYHATAKKQMSGFGGMLAFEIESDRNKMNLFIKNLEMIKLIPSLGGVETTILIPAYSSHFFMTPEERKALDISVGLIRVNTGIEYIEDIIEDFERGLQGI
ncbi:PLP-dependent transferase [bacterium]|nr:MAG: PLP-dependent transferase [bacterium]